MKVGSKVEQKPFTPFTLWVEFETREQALRWHELLSLTYSIPEVLYDNAKCDEGLKLSDEMRQIRHQILKHL